MQNFLQTNHSDRSGGLQPAGALRQPTLRWLLPNLESIDDLQRGCRVVQFFTCRQGPVGADVYRTSLSHHSLSVWAAEVDLKY